MNKFSETFKNSHVILPVIHVEDEKQAKRNVEIARNAGADGVFLINHSMDHHELLYIQSLFTTLFPNWWLGINCLDLDPLAVFSQVSSCVPGVWVDNAMIEEGQDSQAAAEGILEAQVKNEWKGLYFGGVAFKYQRHVKDLSAAVKIAQRYMDVITTSGSGTGHAAQIEKIQAMKAACPDFPLAIASGITPDNIEDYLPFSDCYLVSTGISKNFIEFDPYRVEQLVKKVREYDARGNYDERNENYTITPLGKRII